MDGGKGADAHVDAELAHCCRQSAFLRNVKPIGKQVRQHLETGATILTAMSRESVATCCRTPSIRKRTSTPWYVGSKWTSLLSRQHRLSQDYVHDLADVFRPRFLQVVQPGIKFATNSEGQVHPTFREVLIIHLFFIGWL